MLLESERYILQLLLPDRAYRKHDEVRPSLISQHRINTVEDTSSVCTSQLLLDVLATERHF
jgi:hypothetical protein